MFSKEGRKDSFHGNFNSLILNGTHYECHLLRVFFLSSFKPDTGDKKALHNIQLCTPIYSQSGTYRFAVDPSLFNIRKSQTNIRKVHIEAAGYLRS